MATPRRCPVCDRQKRVLKNGLRAKHYINVTYALSYRLKVCKGADPDYGSIPPADVIKESKSRSDIRCRCCEQWVRESDDFRPFKHRDRSGKVCRGWRDNQ